jgi:D-arabinose 1-dehydrogenase-like Zn-dependent alcohol dehydrogenase
MYTPRELIMEEMKAVVLGEEGNSLSVTRVAVPEPGPGEVRVAVRACGVSRTVENGIQGSLSGSGAQIPRIPGQEFAGVVDAVGEGVSSTACGDRVVGYVYVTCGECVHCRAGNTSRCPDRNGKVGVTSDGGYAEYITVPASNALPLPEQTGAVGAVVAADAVATPLHACRRADVGTDDTVLVIGAAGRIGIHAVKLARLHGANVVGAEKSDSRQAYVRKVTGIETVDTTDPEFASSVRSIVHDRDGPTVVMDTTGHHPTLRAAWDVMDMGGRFVSFTTAHEYALDVALSEFITTEASLLGTRYADKAEVVSATRLVGDGRIESAHRGTVSLEEVPSIHRRIRADETHGLTIVEPSRTPD